jgi:hypothetical protein
MVLDYLEFKEDLFAVKGGPSPGPRHYREPGRPARWKGSPIN